ncbi:hypothetical protein BH10ACT9_BH10ACT9_18130 [soil metagenome]
MTTPDDVDPQDDPTGMPPTVEGGDPAATLGGGEVNTTGEDSDVDNDENIDPDANPNHEAAKWRTRFRDAERERDEARVQVTSLQESIVASLAASAGIKDASLLEHSGHGLASLLDDRGMPDPEKVKGACAEAIEKYGIARGIRPLPGVHPGSVGAGQTGQRPQDAWKGAFAPKR